MAKTIMDLFKDQKDQIYGPAPTVYIESRGIINPSREAALLASSPNAIADLVGSAAGALLGGNANRPSDTIFKGNSPTSKPVSLVPTVSQLRNAVEPGTEYFVKSEPSAGANIATFVKSATRSPQSAQSAAATAINSFGSKGGKDAFTSYINKLKNSPELVKSYGPKFTIDPLTGKPRKETYKYSEYAPVYGVSDKGDEFLSTSDIEKRSEGTKPLNGKSKWDIVNEKVIGALNDPNKYESELRSIEEQNIGINQTYVKFQIYGYGPSKHILLPGTISGISEDFAPEWNSFKYIGSPFNIYRYGGVERTLKFDVKMYYLDNTTKISMQRNLNRLRKLVYPDENINVVTYSGEPGNPNTPGPSQMYFVPNLVYLTINGLYENMLGIVDSLSFSIDDNTSWANTDDMVYKALDSSKTKPYPTVINVSIGMKIIEKPAIKDNKFQYDDNQEGANKYSNYFTNNQYVIQANKGTLKFETTPSTEPATISNSGPTLTGLSSNNSSNMLWSTPSL